MDNSEPTPILVRNPVTHERHRREVLWQITVPLAVGVLILLALAFLAASQATADQASVWADISLIWMIVPTFVAVLIFFLFLAASIYLVVRIIGELPRIFFQIYGWLLLLGDRMQQVEGKMVEPIVRLQSFTASLSELKRQARRE